MKVSDLLLATGRAIRYKTIVATSPEALDNEVNFHIRDGWQIAVGLAIGIPYAIAGGVVKNSVQVTGFENSLIFCQAMTYG